MKKKRMRPFRGRPLRAAALGAAAAAAAARPRAARAERALLGRRKKPLGVPGDLDDQALALPPAPPAPAKHPDDDGDAAAIFRRLDVNGDGELDGDELRRGLRA